MLFLPVWEGARIENAGETPTCVLRTWRHNISKTIDAGHSPVRRDGLDCPPIAVHREHTIV
jgi:hypothetical protein